MHHPDFRICGKIFATLGYPDENSAVVKLTPDEQRHLVRGDPNVFQAVKGAWGRRGSTSIHLPAAKIEIVREALDAAWRNTVPKRTDADSLAQAHCGADTGHHVVGNFVGAFGATDEDIADVQFVGQ